MVVAAVQPEPISVVASASTVATISDAINEIEARIGQESRRADAPPRERSVLAVARLVMLRRVIDRLLVDLLPGSVRADPTHVGRGVPPDAAV